MHSCLKRSKALYSSCLKWYNITTSGTTNIRAVTVLSTVLFSKSGGPSCHHRRWHQAHRQGRHDGQRGGLDDLGQRLGRSHDIGSDTDGAGPGESRLSHLSLHLWVTRRVTADETWQLIIPSVSEKYLLFRIDQVTWERNRPRQEGFVEFIVYMEDIS